MTEKTMRYDPAILLDNDEVIMLAINEALADDQPRVLLALLHDIAKIKGISVATIAKEIGVNRESLYRTLSGNVMPRIDTVLKILRVCDIALVAHKIPIMPVRAPIKSS